MKMVAKSSCLLYRAIASEEILLLSGDTEKNLGLQGNLRQER